MQCSQEFGRNPLTFSGHFKATAALLRSFAPLRRNPFHFFKISYVGGETVKIVLEVHVIVTLLFQVHFFWSIVFIFSVAIPLLIQSNSTRK